MDLRLTFNEDPVSYDKYRPTYPSKLTEDVIQFADICNKSKALEIGVGTGQATLPFIKTGCDVKGVEIGDELCKFVNNKFSQYDNFNVVNQDFELVELEQESFDLVFSASAFHWIPTETGIPKVIKILKSGGVFVWFSHQAKPSENFLHVHKEIQKVYKRYSEYFGDRPVAGPETRRKEAIMKRDNRHNILKSYGFRDITSKLYDAKEERLYTSNEYIKLMSIFSDHRAMPEEPRNLLFRDVKNAIDNNGGRFALSDTFILCMGCK